MAQEKVVLLVRHAGTTAADRRACIRAEKSTTMRQGLKVAFAILLMSDRPRKLSRDAPNSPSEEVPTDRLHKERADFCKVTEPRPALSWRLHLLRQGLRQLSTQGQRDKKVPSKQALQALGNGRTGRELGVVSVLRNKGDRLPPRRQRTPQRF